MKHAALRNYDNNGRCIAIFMGIAQFIRADYESAKILIDFLFFSSHEFTGAMGINLLSGN